MASRWGFSDADRARSVLAGVSLLGIVALLSMTVGFYVTGFGAAMQPQPQAHLEIHQTGPAGPGESAAALEISHTSGDAIAAADLEVRVDGDPVGATDAAFADGGFSATVGAGDSVRVVQTSPGAFEGGERVTVVYTGGTGGNVLDSYVVEN